MMKQYNKKICILILILILTYLCASCRNGTNPNFQVKTPDTTLNYSSVPTMPVITPTHPAETDKDMQKANEILASMSLYEKICQMIILSPESLTGTGQVTAAGETTKKAIQKMPVGGLIYSKPNFKNKEQISTMTANVQQYTKIPLILTCDEEGGRVNRLMATVGTTYIGPMLSYKDKGINTAYQNAHIIANDMQALGLNFDLAPVADIWSNTSNKVIGDRAYSDDFKQGASLVAAAVQGFHEGGVGTALKHFPGHGDTSADSHNGAVFVRKTLEQIRAAELLPFKAGIEAGSDMVMIGHLILSDADTEPATFSYKIITELLRGELEFNGVVITDSLEMGAVTKYYSSADAAKKAVSAGIDILLCPSDPESTIDALSKAVETGEITEARIDESVRRIILMKINRGIIK